MSALALRAELDRLRCSEPGCDCDPGEGVVIASVCHPDMPLLATYKDGELALTCYECDGEVLRIAVAG